MALAGVADPSGLMRPDPRGPSGRTAAPDDSPTEANAPLLALRGMTKRFRGITALADVSFDLRAGEVHALMGENGAGKSTLMKIAAGLHVPEQGTIAVNGVEQPVATPAEAQALGIQTVFQELTVLENLDVGRNVLIGREPRRWGGLLMDSAAIHDRAQAVLDRYGIALDARQPVARLSTGEKQMIEIARACSVAPRVLILDEPTSSLGRNEEAVLFALIRQLRDDGVGIIYISHRMSEVFELADRVTVLRDGRHVVTGDALEFTRDSLIRAMVGRTTQTPEKSAAATAPTPALSVQGLCRPPRVAPVDLTLHEGEVLGLAGLMGAGRSELARLIAGIDRPQGGTMTLRGEPFAPDSVSAAVRAGVAYLPEDRKTQGLVRTLSVAENIALPNLRRFTERGLVRLDRLRDLAREWSDRLGIKASSPQVRVTTLSGGNQQKVVLAKWLATRPSVILLDEPTRGVDVGAKAEIHQLIRDLAGEGAAILMISSELPEILGVSDRIAVMARGAITGIVSAGEASEESLLSLAFAERDSDAAAA